MGPKAAVVLDLIKGRATAADIARHFNPTIAEVNGWVERLLERGKEGLRAAGR